MAAAVIVTALAGFLPSFVETTARRGPLNALVVVHSVLCAAWLLLFTTQVSLVATRRVSVHRRLGVAAGVLAIALVIVGYATAIALVRRGFDLSGDLHIPAVDAAMQMVFPLGDLVSFGLLVTAGYAYRRRADIHKRLMLLATLSGFMPAALAHFIGHVPALSRIQRRLSSSRWSLFILQARFLIDSMEAGFTLFFFGYPYFSSPGQTSEPQLSGQVRLGIISLLRWRVNFVSMLPTAPSMSIFCQLNRSRADHAHAFARLCSHPADPALAGFFEDPNIYVAGCFKQLAMVARAQVRGSQ